MKKALFVLFFVTALMLSSETGNGSSGSGMTRQESSGGQSGEMPRTR